jgi:predicted RNA methylase
MSKIDPHTFIGSKVTIMAQDTGKFRENTKDQYYTRPAIAVQCVQQILAHIDWAAGAQWIEPSAGKGAFLVAAATAGLLGVTGLDIDPKAPDIQKEDFLGWRPATPSIRGPKSIVFGNPPFGRQGSAAKAFIKHSASFADAIAFILPRSFVKPSMSKAFPLPFHCLLSEELAPNSFEVNGEAYDVPCVFQVWERRGVDRPVPVAAKEEGFSYVKAGESFHLAFRRVGGTAGTCVAFETGATYNKQVYYFLRLEDVYVPHVKKIVDAVSAHVFPSNTVGPRSLSKGEATEVLNQVLASLP